ncbi:MAG: hypothetical protein ACI8TQ_002277 [Planctomycetota bacterium]|jgi:hypothetical protein
MNSSKHDCADIRQYLHLLHGGELDSDPLLQQQMQATQEHLTECGACRQELEEAKRSRELYLQAAVDADSEELDLWPGIRSRLYSEQILQPQPGAGLDAAPDALMPSTTANRPKFSLVRRLAPLSTVLAAAAAVLIAMPLLKGALFTDEANAPTGGTVASQVGLAEPLQLGSAPVIGAGDILAEAAPVSANPGSPNSDGGLRPVLSGDESLTEREQRERLEQGLYPDQRLPFGSGPGAFSTHSFEPSLYDVVNQRQVR